ncbi:hypothetical protein N0V90_011016 [Kalmusia sp. IMI 367209]|nr:hypothetical protein N0V90_011016 [Kalmusia sp. IMI 367209]
MFVRSLACAFLLLAGATAQDTTEEGFMTIQTSAPSKTDGESTSACYERYEWILKEYISRQFDRRRRLIRKRFIKHNPKLKWVWFCGTFGIIAWCGLISLPGRWKFLWLGASGVEPVRHPWFCLDVVLNHTLPFVYANLIPL